MVITANTSEFIIDGTTIPTREIIELRSDSTRIYIYYDTNQFTRTLPLKIIHSLVTSFNSSVPPPIASMVSQMQGFVSAAKTGTTDSVITNVADTLSTDEYGFDVENTPMGEMRVVEPVRLVGATFEGATIDSNFWTTAASGTAATIAQSNAQILITSGTANAATVTMYSFRRARYVGGAAMRYRAAIQLGDSGTPNNRRRWGIGFGASMPTITDGAYFQLDGTEFSVNTIRGGVATKVTAFNGTIGTTYVPGLTSTTYEIYWTNTRVYFVIGGMVLHTHTASNETWSGTLNFHVFADSLNSGAISPSVTMSVRVSTIYRLGKIETAPIWRNINTAAVTGLILKRGPGRLHHVTFNTIPNTTIISIYDALTATNPICVMNPPNGATPFVMNFDIDFYNGLTITTTPAACDLTVVWE